MADATASGRGPDVHVYSPPADCHSPTNHDVLSTLAGGPSIPPVEIPKRESISSASEVPSQISPPPGLQQSLNGSAVISPIGSVQQWAPIANGTAPSLPSADPERNYLALYELKQAQLEQAEKAHKELMEEALNARTRAEELSDKIQTELRQEVKSVRKDEASLREKVEAQLRKEREIWNAERLMLMQKMKSLGEQNPFFIKLQHKEQENLALRMRIEQLKNRLSVLQLRDGINDGISPGPEDGMDFYSPSRHSSTSSRRIASPDGRNGRHSSADRYAFFSPRRATPMTLKAQEMPYEPPASVIPPLSPPPAAYRRHAGHTPGASVSLRSPNAEAENHERHGADTPTQANFGSLAGIASNGGLAAESMREETLRRANAQLVEDPPLTGALGLRNDPEESTLFLDILNKKLSDVSEDPLSNKPAVMKRGTDELSVISESVDGRNVLDHGEGAEEHTSDEANGEGRETEKAKRADGEGITLRLKPSMNFGAPLGYAFSG